MKITNPTAKIIKKIKEAINSLPEQSKVIVGVSGGCDSMTLLDSIHRVNRGKLGLIAVHVNHNLRGEESDSDEQVVKKFCEDRQIYLVTKNVYPNKDKQKGDSTEMTCRNLRYNAFGEVAKRYRIKHVILAHNQNDQAETVLMKICVSGNTSGFSGMKEISHRDGLTLVRPLLSISRAEIESYAKHNRVPYSTDSSNSDTKYTRNYIRTEITPKLSRINNLAIQHIYAASAEFAEMEDWLESHVNKDMKARSFEFTVPSASTSVKAQGFIVLDHLRFPPVYSPFFLAKRAFLGWLSKFDVDLRSVSSQTIESVFAPLKNNVWRWHFFNKKGGGKIWFIKKKHDDNVTSLFEVTDGMISSRKEWMKQWNIEDKDDPFK